MHFSLSGGEGRGTNKQKKKNHMIENIATYKSLLASLFVYLFCLS